MKYTKQDRLPRWLEHLVFYSLAGIVILLPIHAFLSTWGGTHIGPLWLWKSWKEIVLFVEALVISGWLLLRSRLVRQLLRDRLWQVLMAFVVTVLVLAFVHTASVGNKVTWVGLAFDLRYFVAFFLAFVLFRFGSSDRAVWLHRAKYFVAYASLALVVLGALQVSVLPRDLLAQFGYERGVTIAPYMTIDEKSPDIIRAFATLRGPNDYGAYLVIGLVAAISLASSWRIRLLMAGVVASGIVLSQSRSAMAAAVIALGVWGMIHFRTHVRKYILPLSAGIVLAGGLLVIAALNSPTLRLLVFHSSPHDTHLTEGNIDGHNEAITSTLRRIIEQPFGCGPGCSGPASFYGDSARISENYYLQITEEYGVVGAVLWLGGVLLVVRRLLALPDRQERAWLIASFAGLSFIGLLLHVWVDDPISITWWVCAGAFLGYSGTEHRWNKSKNNSPSRTSSSL